MFGYNLGIAEFQEKLKCSTFKTKLYVEMIDKLAKANPNQILKKSCALSKTGLGNL